MKHNKITWLCLLIFLFTSFYVYDVAAQGVSKTITVGYVRQKVVDAGDEGEGSDGWEASPCYWDGFDAGLFSSKAIFIGCKSFTDTTGTTFSPMISGHGQWEVDERHVMMPVPDKDGWTIHRYLRRQPPTITVDGLRMDDPFPINPSDEVAPDKIPGTADEMIESWVNTSMGITIHQRVFGFSQIHYEKTIIIEWTFKNTGNVDTDPDIELHQTLEDVYFLKQLRPNEWVKPWISSYGEMPGDTLRIMYSYPQRVEGVDWDMFGDVDETTGFIRHPWYIGEAITFASAAVNDMLNDDVNQPVNTAFSDCDLEYVTRHPLNLTASQKATLYDIMREGLTLATPDYGTPDIPGSKPGHHQIRLDERGIKYASDMENYGYTATPLYSIGPYTLAPGDSFKVIMAQVMGTISPEKAWEVGQAWKNDDCHWGDDVPGGPTSNLPPQYKVYPELYAADSHASELSNWAKDCWVATGKDSLFKNAAAAKWVCDHNYNIPQPPPPPSIKVTSLPDRIVVEWGDESETVNDFAGYRVYRATGDWFPHVEEGENRLIGHWELVYECGEGTSNPVTHKYEDTNAQRGIAYYYCVTAVDNGTQNPPDFNGKVERLESNKLANMTRKAAHLTRPAASSLDNVKIVPNPYNISASQLQYTGEPNKVMFLNLPIECTIKIYTESGDLIKTIHHYGSGDEPWGVLEEEHMTTSSDQLVVSGIYLVYFETPDGHHTIKKLVVVR